MSHSFIHLFLHSFTLPIEPCSVPKVCFYTEKGPFSKLHTDAVFLATTLLIGYLLPISDHYLMFLFLFGGIFAKLILFSLCVFFMYTNGILELGVSTEMPIDYSNSPADGSTVS